MTSITSRDISPGTELGMPMHFRVGPDTNLRSHDASA